MNKSWRDQWAERLDDMCEIVPPRIDLAEIFFRPKYVFNRVAPLPWVISFGE